MLESGAHLYVFNVLGVHATLPRRMFSQAVWLCNWGDSLNTFSDRNMRDLQESVPNQFCWVVCRKRWFNFVSSLKPFKNQMMMILIMMMTHRKNMDKLSWFQTLSWSVLM